MKQCSSCAREIPDTATVCDLCRQWAVDVASPAASSAAASPEAPRSQGVTTAPRRSGPNRRELLIILAVLFGSGLLTLGLLSARSAPASAVTPARAASRPQPSASANAQPESATQKWNSENRAYWVGNRPRSAAFELPAENTVSVWTRYVRPTLVVRCMSQSIQTFVVTESALKIEPQTDDHTVTFSFDDEPPTTERWADSDEHDALFAPDGSAFAQRLMRARSFRFGYTPHNASAVTAVFSVGGLAPLMEPAAKECALKK